MKDWQQNIGNVNLFRNDIQVWDVEIVGPKKSPYEARPFKVRFDFRGDYPIEPPKINFLTKVFHPGVHQKTGAVDMTPV
jgi:ubiquitin-protein ligase